MPKKTVEETYGLPRLTFAEAARLLGVGERDFRMWLFERLPPRNRKHWSEWMRAERGLPEVVIRLYLTEQTGKQEARPGETGSPPSVRIVGSGETAG